MNERESKDNKVSEYFKYRADEFGVVTDDKGRVMIVVGPVRHFHAIKHGNQLIYSMIDYFGNPNTGKVNLDSDGLPV